MNEILTDEMFLSSEGERAEELQRLIDALFLDSSRISQMDLLIRAESFDLDSDVTEVVELMPPGIYSRQALTSQLNSIITAHGWGATLGTVC